MMLSGTQISGLVVAGMGLRTLERVLRPFLRIHGARPAYGGLAHSTCAMCAGHAAGVEMRFACACSVLTHPFTGATAFRQVPVREHTSIKHLMAQRGHFQLEHLELGRALLECMCGGRQSSVIFSKLL